MAKRIEFIDRLYEILARPAVFAIQRIEDINVIFVAEIHINRNKELEDFYQAFSKFISRQNEGCFENFEWCKIIRLYSGSDFHSIELFKYYLERYLEEA